MKVTLNTAQLQDMCDIISRFVSKHSTLPILENVYIKWSGDQFVMRATDMEKYVHVSFTAHIIEEGALTVNAKMFTDIIKALDDEHVTIAIDTQKDSLTIKTVSDNFSMKGIPAQEYVAIPEVRSENSVTLDAKHVTSGIGKVEYAVTEKNFSPVLTGIFVRTKEYNGQQYLVFVGTDSFRLAEYKIPVSGLSQWFELIIPKTNCNDLKKVIEYYISQGGQEITMKHADNLICFTMDINGVSLTTTFPEYDNENIIPTLANAKLQVDKSNLDKAIRKIQIITRDINNYISLNCQEATLIVQSGETDKGDAQSSLLSVMQGDPVVLGLNGKYVADFIRAIGSPDIRMHIVNSEKPVVMYDTQDDAYRYVVRPLIK
jgi:DNA polymerase III subunit beta